MIIGISGKAGSGKDEVAKMLRYCLVKPRVFQYFWIYNLFGYFGKNWKIYAFADKMKQAMSLISGIKLECFYDRALKNRPEFRRAMQSFGDWTQQKFGKPVWVNALFYEMDPHENAIISDVRFLHEIEKIKQHRNILLNVKSKIDSSKDIHASENELNNFEFDKTINLFYQIKDLRKTLKEEYNI